MAQFLLWWNLVYVVAFFFALVYAGLNVLGLGGEGAEAEADVDADVDLDADVDVDADVDLDADIEADVDVDADVDADADMDMDADVDAEAELDADVGADLEAEAAHVRFGTFSEALSFFGLGKVPLSVLMMTFLLTFSIVGWSGNVLLKDMLRSPAIFFPMSCAAALFCGISMMKLVAATVGKYLRPIESSAVSRSSLVGRVGRASITVTGKFGQALVLDEHGSTHKVVCRVAEGKERIPSRSSLLLIKFVLTKRRGRRSRGYYLVEPYEVPKV